MTKKVKKIFVLFFACLLLVGMFGVIFQLNHINMEKKSPLPRVSVIIPVYNTAPYLARCLDSVIGQTFKEIEIICVDDASTDRSLAILKEYAKKDQRITVIHLRKNKGVSNARNEGIKRARGEFIGFVDSDDFIDSGWYENLYSQSQGFDFIRGVYLLNGWYVHNNPYLVLVPSLIRTKFIKEKGIVFENIPHEDSVFASKLRAFEAKRKDVSDNGQRYHYERRLGSLMNFPQKKVQKNMDKGKSKLNIIFMNIQDQDLSKIKSIIQSIDENNVSKSKYVFWILGQKISSKNEKELRKYAEKFDQESAVIAMDPQSVEQWKMYPHSTETSKRLGNLVADLLPKTVEKAVYLDTDTIIVTRDLKPVFDENLKGDSVQNMILVSQNGGFQGEITLLNLMKIRQDKKNIKSATQ